MERPCGKYLEELPGNVRSQRGKDGWLVFGCDSGSESLRWKGPAADTWSVSEEADTWAHVRKLP